MMENSAERYAMAEVTVRITNDNHLMVTCKPDISNDVVLWMLTYAMEELKRSMANEAPFIQEEQEDAEAEDLMRRLLKNGGSDKGSNNLH